MVKEGSQNSKYRIWLFCIATMMFWFSLYTYVPIFTPYIEGLGASHKMAGMIVGSYGFTQMILRIPVGIISDRIHKRKLFITFGMFFSLFSVLGLLISKNLGLILFFRAFAGAAAATWVDFTILFSSYYEHNEASKAIGTISFFNTIGQMLGMYFGSLAADKAGEFAAFAMGVAAASVGVLLSMFLVEKYDEGKEKITLKGVLSVVSDRTLLTVSFLAILSQVITFSTTMGFTPAFAEDVLGATKYQMGLLTVFFSLPSAIASIAAGRYLAGKFGDRPVIVTGLFISGLFTITIPFTNSIGLLILTQILSGFGKGLSFTLLMSLSIKGMPADKRATAMGFFQSIYGLGMFAGPVIMGIFGDLTGLEEGFVWLGILGIATAVLAFFMCGMNKKYSGISQFSIHKIK